MSLMALNSLKSDQKSEDNHNNITACQEDTSINGTPQLNTSISNIKYNFLLF